MCRTTYGAPHAGRVVAMWVVATRECTASRAARSVVAGARREMCLVCTRRRIRLLCWGTQLSNGEAGWWAVAVGVDVGPSYTNGQLLFAFKKWLKVVCRNSCLTAVADTLHMQACLHCDATAHMYRFLSYVYVFAVRLLRSAPSRTAPHCRFPPLSSSLAPSDRRCPEAAPLV